LRAAVGELGHELAIVEGIERRFAGDGGQRGAGEPETLAAACCWARSGRAGVAVKKQGQRRRMRAGLGRFVVAGFHGRDLFGKASVLRAGLLALVLARARRAVKSALDGRPNPDHRSITACPARDETS